MQPKPDRGVWIAWGCALWGGLLVLIATVVTLTGPCGSSDGAVLPVACATSSTTTVATSLAVGGTLLAAGGMFIATLLTVRRIHHHRDPGPTDRDVPDGARDPV